MERTKEGPTGPVKIRYKKIGGGSLRLEDPARIIPPGATFLAYPHEIPAAFKDVVIPLDNVISDPEEVLVAKKPVYSIVPRGKSKSLFDIVDENEKRINEAPLKKEDAENLLKDLEG